MNHHDDLVSFFSWVYRIRSFLLKNQVHRSFRYFLNQSLYFLQVHKSIEVDDCPKKLHWPRLPTSNPSLYRCLSWSENRIDYWDLLFLVRRGSLTYVKVSSRCHRVEPSVRLGSRSVSWVLPYSMIPTGPHRVHRRGLPMKGTFRVVLLYLISSIEGIRSKNVYVPV